MIYAFKKQGESNERLMNRFKKVVQRSRLIIIKKKSKFHEREKSKLFVRKAAVMRAGYRKKRERQKHYA